MGFDLTRFTDEIDEELICPICSCVLEDPTQVPECEHAFCHECISEWLSRQNTCPVDRNFTLLAHLKPAPRILRNLLNKLNIRCENAVHGCTEVLRLELLPDHLALCQFNPKRPVVCENCNFVVAQDELRNHNCIRELRKQHEESLEKLTSLESEVHNLRTELNTVQEFILGLRNSPSFANADSNSWPVDETFRWKCNLPIARVTRWGGMISTPDAVLQAVIKRALVDSGCPARTVSLLMSNAHERCWPSGLQNLETRQVNRGYYEGYVCRRIPGRQAVVVMASDNRHMEPHMIAEPGIVMIFAHGVE